MEPGADDWEARFTRRFLAYFAVWVVTVVFAYIAAITFLPIPETNVRFADTALGFLLGTVVGVVMKFFYDGSRSSQVKDKVISNMVAPAPVAPTPEPPKVDPTLKQGEAQ